MEQSKADIILAYLEKQLEDKKITLDTNFWTEIGLKLNIALGSEQDKLVDDAKKVAGLKLMFLESQEKKNVSEAKLRVEASKEYADFKKQDMKCKRIEEFVRLAKKMSDRSAGF